MTVCANCYTTEGPFTRRFGVGPICKMLPDEKHTESGCKCRITKCVQRRAKIDYDRYEKGKE